jgi:hypothetical protein
LEERAPLGFVLPGEGLIELSPASDGIGEAYFLPGSRLTLEGYAASESRLEPVPSCPPLTLPIPNQGVQPITVHDFLQDMSASSRRAGRKYGRRNRLATVKLDGYNRSENCCGDPTLLTPSNSHVEESRNDRRLSAYKQHPSRRVPHLRRTGKKQLAKPLAQRLFEADVFSSGTSSRPHFLSDLRDPAPHTSSSRRPLQFVTSLNLTPSLESRIYPKKKDWSDGKAAGTASAAADPEIWAVSQADGGPAAPAGTSSNGLGAAVETCRKPWSRRNWNGTRTGASGTAVLVSGTRASRMCGDRLSTAQALPPSPFEYVPLPLVRVAARSTDSVDQRSYAKFANPRGGHGTHAGVKANFNFGPPLQSPAVCATD